MNTFYTISMITFFALFLTACNDHNDHVIQGSPSSPLPQANFEINTSYEINDQYNSPNQDAREMFVVVHYTAIPLQETLSRFMNSTYGASSHYVIPELPENQKFTVYKLVPENRRAWHAGVSFWQGNRNINASSIGIELENLGFPEADESLPLMQKRWYPYASKQQIDALASILKDIIERYKITPTRVIGHSDIAPGRKTDPGPLFPWQQLYEQHHIGAWFDVETLDFYKNYAAWKGDITDLQIKLALYGYDVPKNGIFDQATQNAVSAFQMHFYPEKYDGLPDTETVARLDALLEKYRGQARPSI